MKQNTLINRRHVLRGLGVSVALPFLETFARADEPPARRRFVCVANPFGMIADAFFSTGITDRPDIRNILDATRPNNYRLRDIVLHVVASPLLERK